MFRRPRRRSEGAGLPVGWAELSLLLANRDEEAGSGGLRKVRQ